MANTKVKLLYKGFDELRKCSEMQTALTGMIESVAERAGDGYAGDVMVGRKKLIANAYPTDFRSRRETEKSAGAELMRALRG